MIAKVYVPQVVYRTKDFHDGHSYGQTEKKRVPLFDLSPAAHFGEVTPILDHEDNPLFLAKMTTKIKDALESFNPSVDYLMAIGDPSVLAICAGLILRRASKFNMLKWDKRTRTYIKLEINV